MTILNFPDGTRCYMDGKLDTETDKVKKYVGKDDDAVYIIDGSEGSGKSVLAQQVAKKLDPTFDETRMCMNAEEFNSVITKAKQYHAVVFDEAFRGLNSREALGATNKLLITKMMEMRQKNLFVIIVLPSFFMLERYVALHRAKGLFHVYRKNGKRGFWMFFSMRRKQKLYLLGKQMMTYSGKGFPSSNFKGRFYNQYVINEEKYRKRKHESFKADTILVTNRNKSEIRDDRNLILRGLFDDFKNIKVLSNGSISKTEIARKCKDWGLKVSDPGSVNSAIEKGQEQFLRLRQIKKNME